MSNDKIIGLPTDQNEMKAAIAVMKRDLPEVIEHAKLVAQIKRAAYLEYVEQGFTEEQAIELIKESIFL